MMAPSIMFGGLDYCCILLLGFSREFLIHAVFCNSSPRMPNPPQVKDLRETRCPTRMQFLINISSTLMHRISPPPSISTHTVRESTAFPISWLVVLQSCLARKGHTLIFLDDVACIERLYEDWDVRGHCVRILQTLRPPKAQLWFLSFPRKY